MRGDRFGPGEGGRDEALPGIDLTPRFLSWREPDVLSSETVLSAAGSGERRLSSVGNFRGTSRAVSIEADLSRSLEGSLRLSGGRPNSLAGSV